MAGLVASLIGLMAAVPGGAVEVSDFRSGLVCNPGDSGWICLQTQDIQLTGQGRCTFDGEELPCTWYGFSFRYSGNKPGTRLECRYKQGMPAFMGNPAEVIAENATEGSFSVALEGTSGTFYNPQYTVFHVREPGQATDSISTSCSIEGKEVASFRFNIIVAEGPR